MPASETPRSSRGSQRIAVPILAGAVIVAVAIAIPKAGSPSRAAAPTATATARPSAGPRDVPVDEPQTTAPTTLTGGYLLESGGAGLRQLATAEAVVQKKGFLPVESGGFQGGGRGLGVVVGHQADVASSGAMQAFFFDGSVFVGTDRPTESREITIRWSGGTVALDYGLAREEDPRCCGTAGAATIRYELVDDTVRALDPMPTSDAKGKLLH